MFNLIDGSYKGYSFLLDKASYKRGKNVELHEFLNTNKNLIIDHGATTPNFNLDVLIKGDSLSDDHSTRDEFINVLESIGVGMLSHPYFGEIKAIAKDWSISGITNGYNIFTINFIESIEEESTTFDFKREVKKAIEDVKSVIIENQKGFSIDNLVNHYYRLLVNGVVDILDFLSEIKKFVDYSDYIEKADRLVLLATNRDYWLNMFEFYEDYFNYEKYISSQTKNIFKKIINPKLKLPTGSELKEELKYISAYNTQAEIIKYVAYYKLLDVSEDLTNLEIDYINKSIEQTINNLQFKDSLGLLIKIKSLFNKAKKKEYETITIDEATPLLVVANSVGVDVEVMADINAIDNPNSIGGILSYV